MMVFICERGFSDTARRATWLSFNTTMPPVFENRSGWREISMMSAWRVMAQKASKPSGSKYRMGSLRSWAQAPYGAPLSA